MKILLINPKNNSGYFDTDLYPPLGLLYVAAYAREKGYGSIKILDCANDKSISQELIINEIKSADVVGVGGFSSQFAHAIEISRLCKEYDKFSICGGLHVSTMPALALEQSDFDVIVKGEGELSFVDILNFIDGKKSLSDVEGIAYRSNGSKITENKDRELMPDLNILPFPARDLLPMANYRAKDELQDTFHTSVQTTRGCPFECTFCNSPIMWRRKLRGRDPKKLFQEICQLRSNYGFKIVQLADDGFTFKRQDVVDFCEIMISEKPDVKWACVSRPECVDLELLKKMKQAGCIRISIGVESANPEILKRAKKNYQIPKIREAVNLAKEAGLMVHCYMMIGLPGENIRTFWQSVCFMRNLKPTRVGWAVVVPYPGTELFNKKLVKITEPDYLKWGGYLRPVIRVGILSPLILRLMQVFANFMTQEAHMEMRLGHATLHVFAWHMPIFFLSRMGPRLKVLGRKNKDC